MRHHIDNNTRASSEIVLQLFIYSKHLFYDAQILCSEYE